MNGAGAAAPEKEDAGQEVRRVEAVDGAGDNGVEGGAVADVDE